MIERRLGGYKRQVNAVDISRPARADSSRARRALVVGGGVAGISAAATLAERGVRVTLVERNTYLGGKVGAWPVTFDDGETLLVEHGYHAFFRCYHNLLRLLDKAGVTQHLKPIEDYAIVTRDGRELSFRGIDTTPILNLFSMARRGLYRFRDLPMGPQAKGMLDLLSYDGEATFARYDGVSFEEFATKVGLPPDLKLCFNTFARAFFASEDRISMAELIKSMHFYYLGQDAGLVFDGLDGDYERTLLTPLRELLVRGGVEIALGRSVEGLQRDGDGFSVSGERYDDVILATDVVGTRRIAEASPFLAAEAPGLHAALGALRPSQRYAVIRLWIDRAFTRPLPGFFITERIYVLDAVAIYERLEEESKAWVAEHGGSVIELHSYAVPDELPGEAEIRARMLDEFEAHFPEMKGARVVREVMQVKADFTAFHVGMHAGRPSVETGIPGLYLAGDWVKLPYPAMLMEAACMSGVMSANCVLARAGLQEEPVYSVPLRGIFA